MLKISIIMACYNCTAYLSRSVMSVLNQTYKNWELYVLMMDLPMVHMINY